jgi:hypothetical protein
VQDAAHRLPIPVLAPNEALILAGLAAGTTLGVVSSAALALEVFRAEVAAAAHERGTTLCLHAAQAVGALEALMAGDLDRHDRAVAAAVASLPRCDAVLLGQLTMARAAPLASKVAGVGVLTSPDTAVARLRLLCS